jgi:hypothetical protein
MDNINVFLAYRFIIQGIEDWKYHTFSDWVMSHPGQVVITVVSSCYLES